MSSATHVVDAAERTRLAVVVAKTSAIDELSFAQLRRVYLGDPVDVGGKKLIAFNRASTTDERVAFDRLVLGMSPQDVSRYWVDRKIRGQPGSPKAVEPVDVHQRVIVKVENAVGYVRLGDVHANLKVVRIDGKLPTDRGYALEF